MKLLIKVSKLFLINIMLKKILNNQQMLIQWLDFHQLLCVGSLQLHRQILVRLSFFIHVYIGSVEEVGVQVL